ncbi:TetR/AcrR family transcriptional regulator [Mycobacterium deserti]|uniref:TetR/AcrR family transcriptional regulator n=1 Tax=Mycobacterium deserti TaxID=2978347 RepID=A0ABT2MFA1_9MYCO|nr:TetR/AcrR family transcriptional regulator [Mycobacterium deserti]MCT7659790.1 TetR/AcrR family transcriptional regulator [Mycobacterium deserti]
MSRRRGEELESAIRSAVLRLLAERGPGGVTMESVAAEARTSKPVLYRRWPDRTSLLRDSLLGVATAAIPHDDTGSYREDMLAVLRGWAALFTGPHAAVIRAAAAAAVNDAELTATFRDDVIGWRKQEMAALLHRGIARGDVRADVPVDIARELGQSVLWHRLLITGDEITDELIVALVDDVLVPFVAPRPDRYYEL